jgi:hypothetical protein
MANERVRSVPTHFLYAPGHERGLRHSRTVEHGLVVEKLDGAREIAAETDARAPGPASKGQPVVEPP